MGTWDIAAVEHAIGVVDGIAKAEASKFARARAKDWRAHVSHMLAGGAGLAHRWTKVPSQLPPV